MSSMTDLFTSGLKQKKVAEKRGSGLRRRIKETTGDGFHTSDGEIYS